MGEDRMALTTDGRRQPGYDDIATPISVRPPTHVDCVDLTQTPSTALTRYVEAKLHAVAPWLMQASGYQQTFEEAYQLCRSGYDFNVIVYEQPVGQYIACYEVANDTPPIDSRRSQKKRRRFRRYWPRFLRPHRGQELQPKYHDEILMVPGQRKWVEVHAGRFIVVPEGTLRWHVASCAF